MAVSHKKKGMDTKEPNSYLDKTLVKNFLELVSKQLSFSTNSKSVYIEIKKLAQVFQVDVAGADFEFWVQDLLYILKKISDYNYGVSAKNVVSYSNFPFGESVEDIKKYEYPDPNVHSISFSIDNTKLADSLKSLTEDRSQTSPTTKSKKLESSQILYLNNIGDLWREPKNKYCYLMGEKSQRHKIIRLLAHDNNYHQTSDMFEKLGGKSQQSIRTEIGKIRGKIKKLLKINGKQLIQERKGSGYRINSTYKIVKTKD